MRAGAGLVFIFIMTGKHPFENSSEEELRQIYQAKRALPISEDDVRGLWTSCDQVDPISICYLLRSFVGHCVIVLVSCLGT